MFAYINFLLMWHYTVFCGILLIWYAYGYMVYGIVSAYMMDALN